MIEILTRLGIALVLSVTLAVLLAWGWDNSDHQSAAPAQMVEAPAGSAAR
ncbi:MAG: hypothetical protein LT081_03630 [Hydrogenophaga sp.]|nr:hypothetical protein [Hydrogenophaga sp.]